MKDLTQLTARLQNHLETLREFTATPGQGVTRLPFTEEARQAVEYLKQQMEEVGLAVRVDNSGAVIGRLEGEDPDAPAILIGSHYDTVKSGGAYDGIAGVVSAIETARLVKESGVKLKHPLEVVATNDEEGIVYGVCFVSSKAMLGRWTLEELKTLKDSKGESIYEAIRRFGLDPDKIGDCRIDPGKVRCFIEIHIEQGPVLDATGIQLGLVDCIAGLQRYRVQMEGESNHAGSTPMHMRKDAVEAATKVVSCIPGWAREEGGGTVGTVGYFQVYPNALNTIAGKVEWVLDCRSAEKEKIDHVVAKMKEKLEEVSQETGVSYTVEQLVNILPGKMDPHLLDLLEDSCKEEGYTYQRMLSGATHDTHLFSEEMDTVMVFIPSKNGVSHSPEESSKYEDLARAVDVVADTILKLNQ